MFESFAKNGGSSNAYTNFLTTAYYFTCQNDFISNLKTLLEFTSYLEIDEKSVDKEKEIISQEIGMYDNDVFWQAYFNMLQGMLKESGMRNNIAGTVEDISKITVSILNKTFESFYTTENAILIMAGDFEQEDDYLFEIVEKSCFLPQAHPALPLAPKESIIVNQSFISRCMPISKPLMYLGFKLPPDNNYNASLRLLSEALLGKATPFFKSCYDDELLTQALSTEVIFGDTNCVLALSGSSEKYEELKERILNTLYYEPLSEEDVSRAKAHLDGQIKMASNSLDTIINLVADNFARNSDLDIFPKYANISIEDLLEQRQLLKNHCLSVILPQKYRA